MNTVSSGGYCWIKKTVPGVKHVNEIPFRTGGANTATALMAYAGKFTVKNHQMVMCGLCSRGRQLPYLDPLQ